MVALLLYVYLVNVKLNFKLNKCWQGSTITFCIHWPGGPEDFKSYWPTKKVTDPNLFLGIHIYSDKKTGTLYNKIYLFIFRTLK